VFVNGTLIGGEELTRQALSSGALQSSVTPARVQASA
jgi:hypothetical protein